MACSYHTKTFIAEPIRRFISETVHKFILEYGITVYSHSPKIQNEIMNVVGSNVISVESGQKAFLKFKKTSKFEIIMSRFFNVKHRNFIHKQKEN